MLSQKTQVLSNAVIGVSGCLLHGLHGLHQCMSANEPLSRRFFQLHIRNFAHSQINMSFECGCREAKIHDALLFFDECEAIFEDREKHGSNHVNMLLTEVEKHEGIIIMATNRCDTSTATETV